MHILITCELVLGISLAFVKVVEWMVFFYGHSYSKQFLTQSCCAHSDLDLIYFGELSVNDSWSPTYMKNIGTS